MKKSIFSVVFLLVIASIGYSFPFHYDTRIIDFKIGYNNPNKDELRSGFALGFDVGQRVDEKVDLYLGLGFYRKTNTDKLKLGSNTNLGLTEDVSRTVSKWSVNHLPLMAGVKINLPVIPDDRFLPYVSGELGYQMLFTQYDYTDTLTNKTKGDSEYYGGFGWKIGTGILYQLGEKSRIFFELNYNGCTVGRSQGGKDYEVDVSGISLMFGLNFVGGF